MRPAVVPPLERWQAAAPGAALRLVSARRSPFSSSTTSAGASGVSSGIARREPSALAAKQGLKRSPRVRLPPTSSRYEPSSERRPAKEPASRQPATQRRVFVGPLDPGRVQLGRDGALAEHVDGARERAAVGREALDERDLAAGRDPRRLQAATSACTRARRCARRGRSGRPRRRTTRSPTVRRCRRLPPCRLPSRPRRRRRPRA